jgi:SAM-dependent methyltransferase
MTNDSNRASTTDPALGVSDIHPIHPFPARMAPSIAFDELPSSSTPMRVLDPMVGSGTTTVVARAKGHTGIGFDTDPLAVLLSRAWSGNVVENAVMRNAETVLDRAKAQHKRLKYGYPRNADTATRDFIDYWFDEDNQLQLRALSEAISQVHDLDKRAVLWCGFSRLIITKSRGASLAMDLSHSRPHKVYQTAPIEPFDEFLQAVKRVIKHIPFKGTATAMPSAEVKRHDARRLPLGNSTIDFVITSPPYLNAIDYVRCSKFSLVWMGYQVSDLQTLRGTNIGSERSGSGLQISEELETLFESIGASALSSRDAGMLRRYIADLNVVLGEIARVLVPNGQAIFVVGDSTIRGTFIKNSDIIRLLGANHNLRLVKRLSRDLLRSRRYLPPPVDGPESARLDERMRQEVIMKFVSDKRPERPN